jgi:uncharacterized repeat protein (TIGR01451 family)
MKGNMMKNIFSKLPNKLMVLVAVIAITLGLGAVGYANFGPDRPTRVWTAQENGFDYVTFNSYTNVPNGIGDERDFLRGVINGSGQGWTDPVGPVQNNDKVTGKILIHNNADPLLNDAPGAPGIARDVNVRIEIPKDLQTAHEVKSFISASNAQPTTIYDGLDITSLNDSLFQLSYVPGSARLGGINGEVLSDDIFTTGIKLDDQKGCFEYLREIVFEMNIEKPGYILQKSGRIKGEGKDDWRKVVNAERGDTIEWRIYFENTGSTVLDDVAIVDDLPSYTDINENSIELINGNNPNGFFFDSSAVQRDGTQVNINIDDYNPGANAYIFMESKIEDHEDIQCGNFQIANIAYATPKLGSRVLDTLNSNTKVNIINEECVEEVITRCDSLTAPTLSLKRGESTVLTAKATAVGTTLEGFIFEVNGEQVQDSASDKYTFTGTETGEYTVTATAKFANGDRKTSDDCKVVIKVTEDKEPSYSCDDFVLILNDRTASVSFIPAASNGATFKDATIDFSADGVKKNSVTTNNVDADGRVRASYTFGQTDVNIKANATVRFNVGDEVKEVTCGDTAVLGVSVTPPTTPTVLPNTGAGSVAGVFAAVTVAGAYAHRVFTLKRQ